MSRTVPIGVASIRSGVKVPTIRYYENIGLLPAPPRTGNNRQNYDAADLRRLVFIRHARELGFEIDAIRALLSIQDNPDQSCGGRCNCTCEALVRTVEEQGACRPQCWGQLPAAH